MSTPDDVVGSRVCVQIKHALSHLPPEPPRQNTATRRRERPAHSDAQSIDAAETLAIVRFAMTARYAYSGTCDKCYEYCQVCEWEEDDCWVCEYVDKGEELCRYCWAAAGAGAAEAHPEWDISDEFAWHPAEGNCDRCFDWGPLWAPESIS
eukprot:7378263-Prymnesium_polylepis.2